MQIVALFLLLSSLQMALSYKFIAIFTYPAKGHFANYKPVLEQLAENGHELVIYTSVLINFEQRLRPSITQIHLPEFQHMLNEIDYTQFHDWLGLHVLLKLLIQMDNFNSKFLDQPDIILLKNSTTKFDGMLVDSGVLNEQLWAMAHKLNIPLLGISANEVGMIRETGEYWNLSVYPPAWTDVYGVQSFVYRMWHFLVENGMAVYYFARNLHCTHLVHTKYGPDMPSCAEITRSFSLIIINTPIVLDFTRPLPATMIRVGFLGRKPAKPLPDSLQQRMDASRHGIIYVSFGSHIDFFKADQRKVRALIEALGKTKYDVLFKWENDTMLAQPKNFFIQKWWPQEDVLAHKNVKLFVSHAGQNGVEQALYNGVPMIMVPFFLDHHQLAKRAEAKGMGKTVQFSQFSEKLLLDTIEEVIRNPSYRANAKRLGDMMSDTPMTPRETAAWWIEYVVRNNGTTDLKPLLLMNTSLWKEHMYDCFLCAILVIYILAKLILRKCLRSRKLEELSKKKND